MNRLVTALVAGLLMASSVPLAGSPADHEKRQKRAVAVREGDRVDVHVTFATRDVGIIREYYAPRYRGLPPGLQKKYERTGKLPPGWQKKMEPFPPTLERQLVVLPDGYRRGVIDGHAVIYRPGSSVIFDVAVLF